MSLLTKLIALFILLVSLWGVIPRLAASGLLNLHGIFWLRDTSVSQANPGAGKNTPARLVSSQASGLLRSALQYDSANMGVRRAITEELLAAGNIDEAVTLANGSHDYACSAGDGRPECWLLRSCLLALEGQEDASLRSWQRGADLAVWRWPPNHLEMVLTTGTYAYRILVGRQPDRSDWRFDLMRLAWQLHKQDEARSEASTLLERDSQSLTSDARAQALFVLAESQETSGDATGALDTLRRVVADDPKLTLGYANLSRIYNALGQPEQAKTFTDRLANLVPQRPLSPRFQETSWGAQLLGYDVVPGAVGVDPLLDLVLYWRLPDNQTPNEPGWMRAGDHWLQFVRLPNLAMNSGFTEDDWVGDGVPTGYVVPNWMYVSTSEQGLFPVQRNGQVSKVFRQLKRDTTANRGNPLAVELATPLHVTPGECFLFDADIGGGSGNGNATVWWRDNTDTNQGFISLVNILGKNRDADPAMSCAPPGASWMHFVLTLSQGEIEWDNMMIVQLPAPPH